MARFWIIALSLAASVWAGAAEAQVTSTFGVRRDPFTGEARMHAGMDLAGKIGTPIYATGDGYVRRARWVGGYGNMVEVEHGFGFESRYGHLSRIMVREGDFVRRGQMIALMGSTGRSTGPHLHYEVRINGSAVAPGKYMQIVFATSPDWNAVRMVALTQPAAPIGVRTASVAMAMPLRTSRSRGVSGKVELNFLGVGSPQGATSSSSFNSGHVSYATGN